MAMVAWPEAAKALSVSEDFAKRCVRLGVLDGDDTGVSPKAIEAGAWVKLGEVQTLLGVSERTARRYVQEGLIPAYRMKTHLKFELSDIEKVIANAKI